jgi:hypothetical protein
MCKSQRIISTFLAFSVLFLLLGCSSTSKRQGNTQKKLFQDPEVAAFMMDAEITEDDTTKFIPNAQNMRPRPSWAQTTSIFFESRDQLRRTGFDVIGNRDISKVRDSIKYKLRDLLSGDVETRVERTIVDSISSHIAGVGKKKKIVRNHIMTIVSRHYSPPLTFNGNYDRNESWTDIRQDTVWFSILFSKQRYIIDQRAKIIAEIEQAKKEAYKYLKIAFNKLSFDNDVESALTALGVASYYISKGGGEAELPDIINPGAITRISFQRKELIKEIDKAIQLQFINLVDDITISRDDVLKIRLKCRNPKKYDLSQVKIRISSTPTLVEHPSTIKLDEKGMAEFSIAINPQVTNPYNREILMNVSFDIFSESVLPQEDWRSWVTSDDYFDLLKELPTKSLPIHTVEFLPRRTWVILNEKNPNSEEFDNDDLHSELEKSIGKHSNLFLIVEKPKWPIGYKKYQQYISGSKSYDDLGSDKYDIENHDLYVLLSIDKTLSNRYDLHLEIGSAKRSQGGIFSSSVLSVSGSAVKSSINGLVEKLLDEYFYRELLIVVPDHHKISTAANDIRVDPDSSINNQHIFKHIPRFLTQNITVKRAKFRPQSKQFYGESFSTSIAPQVQEKFELDVFTPLAGTLTITIKDAVTKKIIPFGSKGLGKAPRITLRRRLLFIPSPLRYRHTDNSSVSTFSIQSIGKYYISVEKDFYTVPFLPHFIAHEVVDDYHPRSSHLNNLVIYLEKSDPKYARKLSLILPGSGQYYLNKQRQALGFFAGAVLSSAITVYSYIQYNNEVGHYNDLKHEYIVSAEEDWASYELKLSKSKTRLNELKPQFYSALITGSVVWTVNIITVTW